MLSAIENDARPRFSLLGVYRGAAQSVNDEVEPATCCVDNSLKDRIGEPVKEPVWSNWNR
jgi:hypothetical protein